MAATAAATAAVRLPAAAQPRIALSEAAAAAVRLRPHPRAVSVLATATSTTKADYFPLAAASHRLRGLLLAAVAQEQEEAAVTTVAEEALENGVAEGESASGDGGTEVQATINTKIYFGNLPYNCDSAQLAGIIQDYASPEMVEVLYDRETGKSRGFAFVTMSTIEECETVIQNLDGSEFGGRILRVNFSDKPKPKDPLYPETAHKLFVGNLAWTVTSDRLGEVFREYGNVVGARVLYDGESGRSRGYGFVCYATKEEMDAALDSLNGLELEGRSMRISLALGKRS